MDVDENKESRPYQYATAIRRQPFFRMEASSMDERVYLET